MINIIDCDILGHVYFATFGNANVGDRISCNLYYSTFHSHVKVSSSLEVIGNLFNNIKTYDLRNLKKTILINLND